MSDAAKLYQVWVYLQAEPLFWLTLTIGAYLLADRLYRASGLFPLLNPVAISIILVSTCLINFGVEYERYFDGAKFIHFLLGPATVALSIPIYLNWNIVVGAKKAIVTSVLLGSLFAIGITYAIAVILQLDLVTTKSLLPRNVTVPIAMGISEIIGGVPSLTAIITIVTGIIGAALGTFVLDQKYGRSRLCLWAGKSWHWHRTRHGQRQRSRCICCCCDGVEWHRYSRDHTARFFHNQRFSLNYRFGHSITIFAGPIKWNLATTSGQTDNRKTKCRIVQI